MIGTVRPVPAHPQVSSIAHDQRTPPQRQAEALADACAYILDHDDNLPETGGRRPQLTVIVRLEDLEQRARSAMLEFGGTLTPASLRMLACDAGVIPVVMNGAGQPLDIGRASRTIPDGLRRAVTARDRGCAHPGCDRPPSWSEIHHIREWQHGGPTDINNLVMLCKAHHRQIHHTDWEIRIRDGLPEFIPPRWINPAKPHAAPSSHTSPHDAVPRPVKPRAPRFRRIDRRRADRRRAPDRRSCSPTVPSPAGVMARAAWTTPER